MITYQKNIIHERWDSMPMKLREAMFSPAYGETLLNILEDNHVSEHKSEIIIRLVGYVMMGLVHPDELDKKIGKELDIDKNIIKEIAEEVDRKIFSQMRDEIMDMYSPIEQAENQDANDSESEEKQEPSPKLELKTEQDSKLEQKNTDIESPIEPKTEIKKIIQKERVESPSRPEITDTDISPNPVEDKPETTKDEPKESSPAPVVIHEEEGFSQPQKSKEEGRKSFSFSLGKFFDENSNDGNKNETPTARVETSGMNSARGGSSSGGKKRTVHYSEYRTPISEESKSFINTDKKEDGPSIKNRIKDFSRDSSATLPPKADRQNDEMKDNTKKEKEDGPSIKGNTIDLRSKEE